MTKAKPYPSPMPEGSPLTLDKINEIIAKVNDRRIIAHVTGFKSGTNGELYGINDGNAVIRIEARTVKTTASQAFGGAYVAFSGATAFSQPPLVVCSWGDVAGLGGDANAGTVNPPIVTPRNITKEGFTVFGARQPNAPVRINYIAVGPS